MHELPGIVATPSFAVAPESFAKEKSEAAARSLEEISHFVRKDEEEQPVSIPQHALEQLTKQGFEFFAGEPQPLDIKSEGRDLISAIRATALAATPILLSDFKILLSEDGHNVYLSNGEMIVRVNPALPLRERYAYLEALGLMVIAPLDTTETIFQVIMPGSNNAIEGARSLLQAEEIVEATPNLFSPIYEKWTPPGPTNPTYGQSWHLNNAGAPGFKRRADVSAEIAWNSTIGTGMKITIIESGFHAGHVDLAGNILTAATFGTGAFTALATMTLGVGSITAAPHGTGTSGIALAIEGNGNDSMGLSFRSQLVFVGYNGALSGFPILRNAILYAIDPSTQVVGALPANGTDVISISLGGPNDGAQLPAQNLLDAIKSAGYTGRTGRGVPVFLAGDNSPQPADIAWNTTQLSINVTRSSSLDLFHAAVYGRTVDFIAPGALVWMPYYAGAPANTYLLQTGTSFATPLTAALAALIMSQKFANPQTSTGPIVNHNTLTWLEVKDIIKRSTIATGLEVPLAAPWLNADPRIPKSNPQPVVALTGALTAITNSSAVAARPAAPVAPQAGDMTLRVTSNATFQKGQAILIGARSMVTAVNAGLNVITVASTAGFSMGQNIVIRSLDQSLLVANASNVAGANVIASNTYLRVQDTIGFQPGDVVQIVDPPNTENVTIATIQNHTRIHLAGGTPTANFHNASNNLVVRNVARQADHAASITAVGAGTITIAPAMPAMPPLARTTIIEVVGTEIRVVRNNPNADGVTLDIDSLLNNHAVGETVFGGRVPVFSPVYGYGRVDAERAIALALAYTHNQRDLMLRNFLADDGVAATNLAVNPIQSPDLWVMNKLSANAYGFTYSTAPPHQFPSSTAAKLDWGCVLTAFTGNVTNTAPLPLNPRPYLNDLHIDDQYLGTAVHTYDVRINAVGAADSFQWRRDAGPWSANIVITGNVQLIDASVNIQFENVTGHNGTEVWTMATRQMRFVFVRVRNRGNLYNGLENFVRVSLALSDESVPGGSLTPFQYPGNFIRTDITAMPAISAVTGAAAQGTFFIGEKSLYRIMPAPKFGKELLAGIPPGEDFIVRVGWNMADIPPAATAFKTYLLAEIVPHDGLNNGNEATNNNNLTYREIIFADIEFKNETGATDLLKTVTVDKFGTALTTKFSVNVKATVGKYTTERVVVAVTREKDNGQKETIYYRHNAGAWQHLDAANNPSPLNFARMTAPVVFSTATPAAGAQASITFKGEFDAAMQHNRVTISVIIHSNRAGAIWVPIGEEAYDITVTEPAANPSGISRTPPPPKPLSYFFTEPASLATAQTPAQAYGPISVAPKDRYRVTDSFTTAANAKAIAICNAIVLVQKVDATNLTVVLKPLRQPGEGFPPVKYYVYRGIKLDTILDAGDNSKVRAAAGANVFITRLIDVFTAQNAGGAVFFSKALGYDPPNQAGATVIDDWFFRKDPNFQLPLVKAGEHMADFNNDFGFEVVLEEGEFQPTYDYARKLFHEIDVTGLPFGTNTEKFSKRVKRELILNFLSPAAFFSMHYEGVVKGGGTDYKAQTIVDTIVSKFLNKSLVYIDVRNENGNSYNFFGNYHGPAGAPAPELNRNIKWGTDAASLAPDFYRTDPADEDSWPILIKELNFTTAEKKIPVSLQLRIDDNIKPILFAETGALSTPNEQGRFVAGVNLLPAPVTNWTKTVTLKIPNEGGVAASKKSIAWLLRLHYSRQIDAATVWPADNRVVKTESFTDNLFGTVDLQPLWDSADNVQWISNQDKRYVDGKALGFGYMAERGVALEGNSVTGAAIFYANCTHNYKTGGVKVAPKRGITGGVSGEASFFKAASFMAGYKLSFGKITDGATTITTMKLVKKTAEVSGPQQTLMIGITRTQWDQLKALPTLSTQYPRYLKLAPVAGAFVGFTKYTLGLQGLQADGTYATVFPNAGSEIFVYSTDRLFYFTDAFTHDQPLPTTYDRSYEENIGAMMNDFNLSYAAGFGITALNQAGKTFTVAGDVSLQVVPGDTITVSGSTGNNGSYTVQSIAVAAATTITVTQAIPNATADGIIVPMNKAIEDYFIGLDYAGVLNGVDQFSKLVNDFRTAVLAVPNNAAAKASLQTHINNFAPKFLQRGREIVNANGHANPDDRPLYWARLKALVILKGHPYLLQTIEEAEGLIQLFDSKSRGWGAVSFAGAPAGARRVLLTGFDPFGLNKALGGDNFLQNNPSGVAALFLHGKTIVHNGKTGFIQTAMIPVRYRDFDNKNVDGFFGPFFVTPNQVDTIATMSQGREFRYDIERFMAKYRNPALTDNEGVLGGEPLYYVPGGQPGDVVPETDNSLLPEFIETTLPVASIVPGTFANAQVIFNQAWDAQGLPDPDRGDSAPGSGNTPTPPAPAAGAISVQGSGGNYLSNEICYRVALQRVKHGSAIKTGHIHLPILQNLVTQDFDKAAFSAFVTRMEEIMKDLIAGL
ncbi:MAG: S8 family serine peptidase [Chitinophagaceae bacterium]